MKQLQKESMRAPSLHDTFVSWVRVVFYEEWNMFLNTGSGNKGTIQAWSHRAIGRLKKLQRRNTIPSHLWKKSPKLPHILAWHMLCLQKWSYAVKWSSCLSIYFFIIAWVWTISTEFDGAAVVSKVWNSYRFHEEKQQHIHPPHWERDSSMSSFLLDTGVPTQRGRAYQRPHCKKSGKEAYLFYNIRAFWPEDLLVRGRKFMKLFVSQKGFGAQLLPQSQSWDLQAEVGTCPQAKQGPLVSEKSGIWHMAFQEQCFVTFALEADGKKGRRKEGSR